MSKHERQKNDGLRKLCGCPRRGWPKCGHPWHFNFKWNGEPFRFSLERRVGKLVRGEDGKWRRARASLGDPITSKTAAQQEADRLRTAIRDGSLLESQDRPILATLTVRQLLDLYDRRYLSQEHASTTLAGDRSQIRVINATTLALPDGSSRMLGDWRFSDVTTDALDQFDTHRRKAGKVAANRNLALLRACFNWAIRMGYLEKSPFKRGTETVIKLRKESKRRRRLHPAEGDQPSEAERLLAACHGHLRAIVEAAIETGCRRANCCRSNGIKSF